MKLKLTIILTIAAIAAVSSPPATYACNISGTNDCLLEGGLLYIPLKPSTSGTLGQSLGRGKQVGLQSDSVSLSRWDDRESSGYVTFDVTLSHPIGQQASLDSAVLGLSFHDLDFKPVVNNGLTFRESVTLQLYDHRGGHSVGNSLTLTESNYGNFTTAGFVATNNASRDYSVFLGDHLGLTQTQLDDLVSDGEFALRVTMRSHLKYSGCSTEVWNTPESIGNSFSFGAPVPEPATISLLLAGSAMALRRKRQK